MALADGARWNRATNTWSPMPMAGAPAARSAHSATWTGTELIVWGGTGAAGDLADGARYNPVTNAWTALPAASAPSARHGHSATWTGSALVIWGGTSGAAGAPLRDGARFAPTTSTWTALSTVGAPTGRSGHDAVWTGQTLLFWGGAVATDATAAAIARLVPNSWTWQSADVPLSARWAHTGVWTGADMIVWGGFAGGPFSSVADGARFNKAAGSWTPVPAAGAPSARGLHSAVWTGTEMIVWGGFTPGGLDTSALGDGARYNPTTGAWTAISAVGAPTARGGHSAVWTGTEMIVWGGFDNNFDGQSDGGRYNPTTNTWAPLAVAASPGARGAHSAIWTGTEMVVWGGLVSIIGSDGQFSDGGRFNPATGVWTALPAAGAPTARGGHTAIWTGTEMIIWAGRGAGNDLRAGGRWSPATGTWQTVTDFDAPAARRFPVAVWTGAEMVVWGGVQGMTNQATGGVLAPAM
jgi:N-acetylneuraminic acid mutarotase